MEEKRQKLDKLRRQRDEIQLTKEIEEEERWIQENQPPPSINPAPTQHTPNFLQDQLPPSINSGPARHTPDLLQDEYFVQVTKDYTSGYKGPSLDSHKVSDEMSYTEFMKHLCLVEGLPMKWGENEEKDLCNEDDYDAFLESRGEKSFMRVFIYEAGGEIDDPWEG